MLSKKDLNRLYHMLKAAREAVGYAKGRSREDLESDRPLIHSLVRCLEIIGEAAGKVSKKYRQENTRIQWEDLIDMRNRLIHVYFDINLKIVWQTVENELPPLITELENIIELTEM